MSRLSMSVERPRRTASRPCSSSVFRLLYGVGCERDLQRAVDELERAVELGSVDSKEDLAKARKNCDNPKAASGNSGNAARSAAVVGESGPKN